MAQLSTRFQIQKKIGYEDLISPILAIMIQAFVSSSS